jgi:cytohesin
MDFWAYALAYRITEDRFMWEVARNIALGQNLGDIGVSPTSETELQKETFSSDPFALLSFLELYRKTSDKAFLEMAMRIGDNILAKRLQKEFFIASAKHIYAKFDAFEPLVLLHLHMAIKEKVHIGPRIWPSRALFTAPYRSRLWASDYMVIYTLTESPYPSRSLEEAAATGDVEEVRSLISQGVDVDVLSEDIFKTPLHRAAIEGHKDVIELLLAKGADVEARCVSGATALHYAAERDRTEITTLLIGNGTDVNIKNSKGDTPLHYAAKAGHKDIVELVISKGADINARDDEGHTPLDIATSRNRKDIVELLISKGADISLHTAVKQGLLEKLKELIGKGRNINAADYWGQTALHYAARRGHQEIVELLLENGADVNIGAYYNLTAAEFAMQGNHNEIVEVLVLKGADISPLHIALYMKDEVKAKSLIESGADVKKRTPYGTTPLDRAAGAGFIDIVKLLIEKGADVNAKDNWNWTPLHSAACYSNKNIVELLITKGADVNARDGNSRIPLWYARDEGHIEIVELLKKHGAKE